MLRLKCPLWVKSRHFEWSCFMSALPPKADILRVVAECPLMTQSGHLGYRIETSAGATVSTTSHFINWNRMILRTSQDRRQSGLSSLGIGSKREN